MFTLLKRFDKQNLIRTFIFSILTITVLMISCEQSTSIKSDNDGVILDSVLYDNIQDAIDVASNGDTIYLTQGIYADNKDKNLSWDGNEKHLTIMLDNNAISAVIECNREGSGFNFNQTNQTEDDVIDGIIITNSGDIWDAGIYCQGVEPTIKNCIIKQCDWCGIYCDNSNPKIENCEIYENIAAIICDNGSNPSIRLNYIENNKTESIYSLDYSHPAIENNLIINNHRGIHCLGGSNADIINCTIANNNSWGLKLRSSTPVRIFNSIIWDNETGFDLTTADSIFLSHSCVQDSLSYPIPDSLNNIFTNPEFIGSGIYSLNNTSPCIDSGINGAVNWDHDIEGENRIYNNVVDMGAYEWQSD